MQVKFDEPTWVVDYDNRTVSVEYKCFLPQTISLKLNDMEIERDTNFENISQGYYTNSILFNNSEVCLITSNSSETTSNLIVTIKPEYLLDKKLYFFLMLCGSGASINLENCSVRIEWTVVGTSIRTIVTKQFNIVNGVACLEIDTSAITDYIDKNEVLLGLQVTTPPSGKNRAYIFSYGVGNSYKKTYSISKSGNYLLSYESIDFSKLSGWSGLAGEPVNKSNTNSYTIRLGNIILYNNTSDNNSLNKTLTEIKVIDGYFRHEVEITNPDITIEYDELYNSGVAPNYLYLKDFNRYYFINNITFVRDGVWELHCSVDVLMSFKDKILKLDAFIERQENEFDETLIDSQLPIASELLVKYDNQSEHSGFSQLIQPSDLVASNKYPIVLNVCVDMNALSDLASISGISDIEKVDTINGFNFCYSLTYKAFLAFCNSMLSGEDFSNLGYLFETQPAQYINSIRLYPFDLVTAQNITSSTTFTFPAFILLGKQLQLTLQNKKVPLFADNVKREEIVAQFKTEPLTIKTSVLKITPPQNIDFINICYTKVYIFIPLYGFLEIEASRVMNKNLIVYYSVDINTGSANAYLCDDDTTAISFYKTRYLECVSVDMGYDLPIGQTNALENKKQLALIGIKSMSNIVDSFVSMGAHSYPTAGNAVVSLAGDGVNALSQPIVDLLKLNGTIMKNTKIDSGFNNRQGGVIKSNNEIIFSGDLDIHYIMYYPKVNIDNFSIYSKLVGRPLMKNKFLKDLKGFTKVSACHIEDLGNATDEEKQQTLTLLQDGVII